MTPRAAGLTPRQRDCVAQLALGMTNKEISQSLGISENTTKKHLQNVMRHLNMFTRLELSLWWLGEAHAPEWIHTGKWPLYLTPDPKPVEPHEVMPHYNAPGNWVCYTCKELIKRA